jgi:hypothetical protein
MASLSGSARVESESIVYGCIRGWAASDPREGGEQHAHNLQVLDDLPEGLWSFLGREMFSCCEQPGAGRYLTSVIHFGASYPGVQYEWNLWVKQFEALLKRLYWSSAVVHLETELNGSHTFRWETDNGLHSPHEGELRMRCAWEHESSVRL